MTKAQENILDPQGWVEKYADYLFNFAVVRLSDAELAEDVVQETFLSALKGQKNFKGNSSERTWLISILKRKIIDIYRKKSTAKEMRMNEQISDDESYQSEGDFKGHWKEGKGPHSHSLLPDGELENQELREIIEKCISLLPGNLASVFIMKMIDEATSEEICKELEITPSNVWVMMHRARLKLRNCIESNWV